MTFLASASIGRSLSSFFDAVGKFLSDLAALHWGALVIGLAFFAANLTLRSRAFFNALRAAYPTERFQWRRIWGAYWAAVGFNNVVPARGGDVIKLFLTKSSVPRSRYPTVAAAFYVESVFDAAIGLLILIYAFTQGVFPKPPAFAKLNAFDISWLAGHFRFTLFLLTVLAVIGVTAFAVLSMRVKAFWANVRQGFTILYDRRRWLREVVAFQVGGWLCRFTSYWFFLDAFRLGGSVHKVLLVFGVQAVAGAVPLTPGGAGVQQALLIKVFGSFSFANSSIVAAYSVGQQIAIALLTAGVGLASVIFIFRFRSFKEVVRAGRASREAERAGLSTAEVAARGPSPPSPPPRPRARTR